MTFRPLLLLWDDISVYPAARGCHFDYPAAPGRQFEVSCYSEKTFRQVYPAAPGRHDIAMYPAAEGRHFDFILLLKAGISTYPVLQDEISTYPVAP